MSHQLRSDQQPHSIVTGRLDARPVAKPGRMVLIGWCCVFQDGVIRDTTMDPGDTPDPTKLPTLHLSISSVGADPESISDGGALRSGERRSRQGR